MAYMQQTELILVNKINSLTRITLNRPRALNAINLQMVEEMLVAVETAQTDGTTIIVIDGAGERGLSGGGDIKEMALDGAKNAHRFIEREYVLDLLIAQSRVPVVGIMSGIAMGGGIGVTGHSTLRIVTENSRLAMPEAKIGIIPDVGGNKLLAASPGRLGEYLAVTSESMNAADAIALGFADLLIPGDEIERFIAALAESESAAASHAALFDFAQGFAVTPGSSELLEKQLWIDQLFERALERSSAVTLETVTSPGAMELADWAVQSATMLVHLAESSDEKEHTSFAEALRQMSPTSVAVSLAQIARTRALSLDLAGVLEDDKRILTRLFVMPDFSEGVRSLVIDKDQNPKWQPATIEELDATVVARVLDPQS